MRMSRCVQSTCACVVAVLLAGCGTHRWSASTRTTSVNARVTAGKPEAHQPARNAPAAGSFAQTIESTDGRLAAALLLARALPNADTYRQVAKEYRRVRVLDKAHEYFSSAVALDPTDAQSFDGLARIWRDWGTPHLGLGDAYRAVYHAPHSASSANTLGTLLQTLKRMEDAKGWYARAIVLDPNAWYALSNLCYAQVMTSEATALATCERAVAAAPDSTVAQNNLALAHTAAGELEMAKKWFRRAGDPSVADYNYGIAMMATRAYKEAAAAFQEALRADPHFTLAAQRAQQARAALAEDDTRDYR